MSYVIAAYAVTVVALVGYGWMLARERSALRKSDSAAGSESAQGGASAKHGRDRT